MWLFSESLTPGGVWGPPCIYAYLITYIRRHSTPNFRYHLRRNRNAILYGRPLPANMPAPGQRIPRACCASGGTSGQNVRAGKTGSSYGDARGFPYLPGYIRRLTHRSHSKGNNSRKRLLTITHFWGLKVLSSCLHLYVPVYKFRKEVKTHSFLAVRDRFLGTFKCLHNGDHQ